MRLRSALAAAALVAALAGAAGASPGDLDPTFNNGTILLVDLSDAGANGTEFHASQIVKRFEKQVDSPRARKVHAEDQRARMLSEAEDIELILVGLRGP